MGLASNYLSAVTAGVVTAGLTAAVAAVPPEQAGASQRGVALTKTEIPIVDTDQTFGPLRVIEKQTAYFDADTPGRLSVGLTQLNSTTLTGPRIDAGLDYGSDQAVTLFGNAVDGYGLGITGTPVGGSGHLDVTGIGDGFGSASLGGYSAKLVAIPSQGLVGDLAFAPIAGGGEVDYTLGDYSLSGTGGGAVASNAHLCLGSTAGCGGVIANAQVSAAGQGGFTFTAPGGSKPITLLSPTNVIAKLEPDELSVTGQVGGKVTIGTRTVGQVRDIDIHIPTTSAVTMAGSRQAQAATNSQPAAGEKVKTAVRAAKHRAQSRHAAAD